jgi:hypothetical protein
MNMIRKGQMRSVEKRDSMGQVAFIASLFGVPVYAEQTEGVFCLARLQKFLQHKHDVLPTSKRMKMGYDRGVVVTERSETGWSKMPETQADLWGAQDP